jgi:microcystin-dependent protein
MHFSSALRVTGLVTVALAVISVSCDYNDLDGIPAGFADGVDNDTQVTPGPGLTQSGSELAADFGGSGSEFGTADTIARSDHHHDSAYVAQDDDRLVPAGAIMAFGGVSAPTGWLLCDGSAVSRATYADLFAAIGTTYGVGNGTTTFNLPDLRQRFPLGKASSGTGSVLGQAGGAIDHSHSVSLATANLPSHAHTFSATTPSGGGHTHQYARQVNVGRAAGAEDSNCGSTIFNNVVGSGSHTHTVSGTTGSVGSGTAASTTATNAPYLVVNYIIKH